MEKAIEMMKAIIDDIVNALKNPPKPQIEEPAEPFIEVPDSPDEMYDIMYRLDWTDGLPVIPPTEEGYRRCLPLLAEMLKKSSARCHHCGVWLHWGRSPLMRLWLGACPEYMPLLMAQVRACREIAEMIIITLTGYAPVGTDVYRQWSHPQQTEYQLLQWLVGPREAEQRHAGPWAPVYDAQHRRSYTRTSQTVLLKPAGPGHLLLWRE